MADFTGDIGIVSPLSTITLIIASRYIPPMEIGSIITMIGTGIILTIISSILYSYLTLGETHETPIQSPHNSFVHDYYVSTSENMPLKINTLANNNNNNTNEKRFHIVSFTDPINGRAVIKPNSTFEYNPNQNFVGRDIFFYTIADTKGDLATAKVVVNVGHTNHPPTAVNQNVATTNSTNTNVTSKSNDLIKVTRISILDHNATITPASNANYKVDFGKNFGIIKIYNNTFDKIDQINSHTVIFHINKLERNQSKDAVVIVKPETGLTKPSIGLAPTINFGIDGRSISKVITSPLDIVEKVEDVIGKGIQIVHDIKNLTSPSSIPPINNPPAGHVPPLPHPRTTNTPSNLTLNLSNLTLNLSGLIIKSEPANTSKYIVQELLSHITVAATNRSGTTVHYDTLVNATCTRPSGYTFPIGNTTVKCTAKDKAGNNSPVASFEVIVQDKTPPKISIPSNKTVNATSTVGANVAFTATAVDNVDGPTHVTCTRPSGYTFPIGNTTVKCTAKDKAGNNSPVASFEVIVHEYNYSGRPFVLGILFKLDKSMQT